MKEIEKKMKDEQIKTKNEKKKSAQNQKLMRSPLVPSCLLYWFGKKTPKEKRNSRCSIQSKTVSTKNNHP
jgi:hypothetical protein